MEEIKITHDDIIQIATGAGRKEISWKNTEIHWSQFLNKLKSTIRTNETLAEYTKLSKTRQDEIKDVGGFVGGYVANGRRKKGNVLTRSLITLDIDFASHDLWDLFQMNFTNAAALYSTHKHTPEKPRLRLVLPVSRPVTAEEYEPIGRYIANFIGIDMFDDTTYEPERLMYWPSTSKDGEYIFEYQDGEWLNIDNVLKTFINWKDCSCWPLSSRSKDVILHNIKKQGDPLEKTNIVGSFCRTYDIHQAIETFLSADYKACDVDNRYTYVNGSTSAGLVIYQDKFAYSHHSTDPASGHLCNAFDLVRLHKFSDLDERVSKHTDPAKYPSFKAMEDLISKDKAVMNLIFSERQEAIKNDFQDVPSINEEDDETWQEKLKTNRKGICEASRNNIRLILENDPQIKDCFGIDEFSARRVIKRLPPWRNSTDDYRYMRDSDEESLRGYMETRWEIDNKAKISDCLGAEFERGKFHPVREWLDSLSWDGVQRLDTIFIDYLGVDDTTINRLMTRIIFVAAVNRIYKPGYEFDNVLVLVGEQGVGKSKILARLAKNREWFTDGFTVEGKDAYENLRGKLLIEIAELAGFRKADDEAIKNFLTKPSDFYRAAFERYPREWPRQCVFFGTTNDLRFLRDSTGNRRFWPMMVNRSKITKNIWNDLTDNEVNQIWAEAVKHYLNKQITYLLPEYESQITQTREDFAVVDDRIGVLKTYLDMPLPATWEQMDLMQRRNFLAADPLAPNGIKPRETVSIAEIAQECFGLRSEDMTRIKSKDFMTLMSGLSEEWSWTGKTERTIYGVQKVYERKINTKDSYTGVTEESKTIF